MPFNANSYADLIHEWEALLAAVQEHAAELPSAEPYRALLEAALADVKAVKVRQDSLTSTRQGATQDLQAAIEKAREVAMRLRGAVKADLGPKNERLVQFKIAPLRKRQRRREPVEPAPEAPTEPTTPPAVG